MQQSEAAKKNFLLCCFLRGLASQKQCTRALPLISLNTLNAFLHNFLIIPFSHQALQDTHNPPLLICTPPFSHLHGVPKHPFHTHDYTSNPKISRNKVDSQSRSPITPINHLMVFNRNEIISSKSTLFYITPKKLPPLPTNCPFHYITSTNTP